LTQKRTTPAALAVLEQRATNEKKLFIDTIRIRYKHSALSQILLQHSLSPTAGNNFAAAATVRRRFAQKVFNPTDAVGG